jgi:hypothetical protein
LYSITLPPARLSFPETNFDRVVIEDNYERKLAHKTGDKVLLLQRDV